MPYYSSSLRKRISPQARGRYKVDNRSQCMKLEAYSYHYTQYIEDKLGEILRLVDDLSSIEEMITSQELTMVEDSLDKVNERIRAQDIWDCLNILEQVYKTALERYHRMVFLKRAKGREKRVVGTLQSDYSLPPIHRTQRQDMELPDVKKDTSRSTEKKQND